MSTFLYYIRGIVEWALWPFDYLPVWLGLTLVGVLTGVAMLWVVGKTSPQKLVERARDRMSAAILEMLLSLDSPARMFACQGRLFAWSLLYVGALIPSLLILSAPLGLVYLHLDARYGFEPMPVGEPFVVHVELDANVDPANLAIETTGPALRKTSEIVAAKTPDGKSLDAFVRAEFASVGEAAIVVRLGKESAEKSVTSAAPSHGFSTERRSGASVLWAEGWEPPLPEPLRRISVPMVPTSVTLLWMPWWLYWLLVATIAALASKSRLDVAI